MIQRALRSVGVSPLKWSPISSYKSLTSIRYRQMAIKWFYIFLGHTFLWYTILISLRLLRTLFMKDFSDNFGHTLRKFELIILKELLIKSMGLLNVSWDNIYPRILDTYLHVAVRSPIWKGTCTCDIPVENTYTCGAVPLFWIAWTYMICHYCSYKSSMKIDVSYPLNLNLISGSWKYYQVYGTYIFHSHLIG
jgi:hypothetical protein